ncbi:MAG: DegT/DnrJ/EryC1/StrS family aminotransferase [Candidatus Micrarchaeota archaeon]|nr:DegT/DnrJ/EryC1/StrS family aminotransferase [Candidatus Micrarchaeota archaeon]
MARIQMSEPYVGEEELNNVVEAVKTNWISSNGHFIRDFEKGFSGYIGTKHGIAVNNGTSALHLPLVAMGIGKGDKVIVPSMTSIACANTIEYTGAKPVFVDSTKEYWCVDPKDIEKKIDSKTKAIMVVHVYGHPCDMDPIMEVADKHGIPVIEDCAEAHGAEYKKRKVGTFGRVASFSFYGNKIITTGEGGMVLTNDDELAEKMGILRNQGMKPEYKNKYYYDMVGYNFRMTNIQAAIGTAQLKKIDYLVDRHRWMAKTYNKYFEDSKSVVHHPEMKWAKCVYWYYSVLVKKELRDKVTATLNNAGIETRPFFYPIHMLPLYKDGKQSLPVAEDIGFRGLNLPSGPTLKEEQIKEVADAILSVK